MNVGKKSGKILLLMLAGFWLSQAQAQQGGRGSSGRAGGEAGGGGAILVAEFQRLARQVISDQSLTEEHRAILERSLATARIEAVSVLRDAQGRAIPNQEKLLAYSYTGRIQLKIKADLPGHESWETESQRRWVWHIVAHELFIASGRRSSGQPLDHNFGITVGLYDLDRRQPTPMARGVEPIPAGPLSVGLVDVGPCALIPPAMCTRRLLRGN